MSAIVLLAMLWVPFSNCRLGGSARISEPNSDFAYCYIDRVTHGLGEVLIYPGTICMVPYPIPPIPKELR